MDNLYLKIKVRAMEEGESLRIVCPFCNGGSTSERSFTITRNFDSGVYNCYRASCGIKGFIPLNPLALPKTHYVSSENVASKGVLSFGSVDTCNYKVLESTYGLTETVLTVNRVKHARGIEYKKGSVTITLGEGLWVELVDFNYEVFGAYTRRISPFNWTGKGKTWTSRTKVVDFPYYVPVRPDIFHDNYSHTTVYFVEDPLSALKIAQLGFQSVALLGTHFNPNHVLELVKQGYRKIVWMLDADTWQTSGKPAKAKSLSKLVGPIVQHSIEYLTSDPKDLALDVLEEICHRNLK